MQHCSVLLKFTPWPYHLLWLLVLQVSSDVVLVCFVFTIVINVTKCGMHFCISVYLTLALMGGGEGRAPSGFSKIAKNGDALCRHFFEYLISHSVCTLPEIFVPRSSQVKSPGVPSRFLCKLLAGCTNLGGSGKVIASHADS